MPIEYKLLKNEPYAMEKCPKCNQQFPEFMRGMVQSGWRKILRLPYCAVICHNCKEIIGWEKPDMRKISSAKLDNIIHEVEEDISQTKLTQAIESAKYWKLNAQTLATIAIQNGLISRGKYAVLMEIDRCDVDETIAVIMGKKKGM